MIDEVGESSILDYIVPNHEQALAMMVDGASRLSGYGVGFATSGPGAVNLATGIACSFYDSVPCMFITGQVGTFHLKSSKGVRQRGFQETDVISLMRPITKYCTLIDKAEDCRFEFEKALFLSKNGRPGPVVIDLPYDVQRKIVYPSKLRAFEPETPEPSGETQEDIARFVIQKIRNAVKPLLLVGGGVRISGTENEARIFADRCGIPVVTTWSAADIFSQGNSLYLGNIGKSGDEAAVLATQECDLLVALGSRFTPKVIINEKSFARNAEMIAIDIDESELEEGLVIARHRVLADLQQFLPLLVKELQESKVVIQNWLLELDTLRATHQFKPQLADSSGGYVNPFFFAHELFRLMEDDGAIFADAGANLTWVMQGGRPKADQRLISAWGNSPMGYALPAAVGGKIAQPERQVVATIGDGGFQMNIQELQTIVGNNVDIKVFILNNRCYGNIKMGAKREFDSRIHGNDSNSGYSVPDFVKVANAYGLQAFSIQNDDEVESNLNKILGTKGAVIVDVNIHPSQEHVELSIT